MEPLTRDGEGDLIGSGDGTVVGDAIAGALAWTLFERPGSLVCAMNPVAVIETDDGARTITGATREDAPRLVAEAVSAGRKVYGVRVLTSTLEETYLEAVGEETD